jgi:thioredoxin-related protein
MNKVVIFAMVSGIFLATSIFAVKPATLDEARTQAASLNKSILIDFSTSWCKYCKLFARHVETDIDIKKALESVILFETDAEKGEGKVLAGQYNVGAYPTFVLVNSEGKTVDMWVGYEKSYFLKSFSEAIADTSTIDTKITRYQSAPTPGDALSLGRYSSATGDYKAAVEYYQSAQKLRTGTSDDFTFEAFTNTVEGFNKNIFTVKDVVASADAVLTSNDKTPDDVIETAQMMIRVDKKDGKMDMVQKYLDAALKISADSKDEKTMSAHNGLLVEYELFVSNDTAAAVAQKKANLPKGWINDVSALNEFCWWCFENKANLKEAESLARHGVEIAEDGPTKAMIADTAAEICFARGNKEDAVILAKIAINEDPDNNYFVNQLEKFEGKDKGK